MPTPLRYPGGKQRIWRTIADIIVSNGLEGCEYVEPYAGGAGIAIELLNRKVVSKIHINDVNPLISNFWRCILRYPTEICSLIASTPITVEEWDRQKAIIRGNESSPQETAFAFLFLNRTSFSGIINGGIIGGRNQQGRYKMDARYPQERLIRAIEEIASVKQKIKVTGIDAAKCLESIDKKVDNAFVYCDPPYYVKGRQLYLDYYMHGDHCEIAAILQRVAFPWIVTYDNVAPIRSMYKGFKQLPFSLPYSARKHNEGKEVLICSHAINIKSIMMHFNNENDRRK